MFCCCLTQEGDDYGWTEGVRPTRALSSAVVAYVEVMFNPTEDAQWDEAEQEDVIRVADLTNKATRTPR